MKILVHRQALLEIITGPGKIASGKVMIPALSGLLLKAQDGTLSVTGYDLDIGIEATIRTPPGENGVALVPAKRFVGIIKALPDDSMSLAHDGGTLTIKSGAARFTLQTMDVDEFPALPAVEGDVVEIPAAEFKKSLRKTGFTCRTSTHWATLAVNCEMGNGRMTMIGTDTFRMAVRESEGPHCEPFNVLIRAGTFPELSKLLGSVLKMCVSPGHVQFVDDEGTRIIARLPEGQYPNWRGVIPEPGGEKCCYNVDRSEMMDAIKRARIMCEDDMEALRFEVDKDDPQVLTVIARDKEIGGARAQVAVWHAKGGTKEHFRPSYMLDGLAVMDSESAEVKTRGLKPLTIHDADDAGWVYVVMPIREAPGPEW